MIKKLSTLAFVIFASNACITQLKASQYDQKAKVWFDQYVKPDIAKPIAQYLYYSIKTNKAMQEKHTPDQSTRELAGQVRGENMANPNMKAAIDQLLQEDPALVDAYFVAAYNQIYKYLKSKNDLKIGSVGVHYPFPQPDASKDFPATI